MAFANMFRRNCLHLPRLAAAMAGVTVDRCCETCRTAPCLDRMLFFQNFKQLISNDGNLNSFVFFSMSLRSFFEANAMNITGRLLKMMMTWCMEEKSWEMQLNTRKTYKVVKTRL